MSPKPTAAMLENDGVGQRSGTRPFFGIGRVPEKAERALLEVDQDRFDQWTQGTRRRRLEPLYRSAIARL